MSEILAKSYKNTRYKLDGNGKYSIRQLQIPMENVDEDKQIDFYGNGAIINDFEDKIAEMLGKDKAVFFPSGTMAQQIALRMWCDMKQIYRVAYHPLSHLEIYEQDGLKKLHNIETVLLGEQDRLFTIDDLKKRGTDISTLLIELPQRGIGGQLPNWDELNEILDYCKKNNIRTHLDGARLWEITPYYQKELKEICAGFDSVYVSFYKGIGSVAGAILVGPKEFIDESKIWKRRYGGDLISLYPYVISADYWFDRRINKMETYYNKAKELSKYFNSIDGIYTIPKIPVSNMFHVHFSKDVDNINKILAEIMNKISVGITPYLMETKNTWMFEICIGDSYEEIPKDILEKCFQELDTNINHR
ncbi:threonine aldolase family protein [Vallitalea maricola]|uniref:Aminotransferase class I/II-fold pyridoxal phosphate-dependent enzyme n=1 Tax=Vallitalea maricola TaxID=3074433 RepID=A0ACB5UM69_9FIRM|nr:aminotransferase class I/II-fold pyridoxal phosphate-dependent enzyme [Vallitalea sp. AN17-2]